MRKFGDRQSVLHPMRQWTSESFRTGQRSLLRTAAGAIANAASWSCCSRSIGLEKKGNERISVEIARLSDSTACATKGLASFE